MDIQYPLLVAAPIISMAATGTLAATIESQLTIIDGVTVAGTANRTINLTIGSLVKAGAMLLIKTKVSGATYTTIFGTNMSGVTLTGADGKTKNVLFIYDGTNFVEATTPIQID